MGLLGGRVGKLIGEATMDSRKGRRFHKILRVDSQFPILFDHRSLQKTVASFGFLMVS